MRTQWTKWEPIPHLTEKYNLKSISDGENGTEIILFDIKNSNHKVEISFTYPVDIYRRSDEKYLLETIDQLKQQYGADFYTKWTFFKVTNSPYLQWLSEQSYNITDSTGLTHFALITTNSIVDIIDPCEPKIKLINE